MCSLPLTFFKVVSSEKPFVTNRHAGVIEWWGVAVHTHVENELVVFDTIHSLTGFGFSIILPKSFGSLSLYSLSFFNFGTFSFSVSLSSPSSSWVGGFWRTR